ncbi:hypothetical protein DFQ28_003701 [Apophysomyces sp. BC1034]|nr:hypothetical protein DFQ30_003687 [Apophysomyces sp. BC1015]KAG0179045.1 hypothetical protein DFQ29_002692 [Apophysomyces sp. BC1021]KAG0189237.1 hypothetical protein DFQ28_003701 [Apophysomyces sp. BC1034]
MTPAFRLTPLRCPLPSLKVSQRSFHALRPTSVLLKAKKNGGVVELLDENDPELLEVEAMKDGELGLASDRAPQHSASATQFSSYYEKLDAETRNPRELNTRPKKSRLNHLLGHVENADEAEQLPKIIEQWRNYRLPLGELTSSKLVEACCRVGRPDVAFDLLGDRYRYGLFPKRTDIERTIEALCKEGAINKACITLAMVPAYDHMKTGSMYASLLEACVKAEEQEKAELIADELIRAEDINNKSDARTALEKVANILDGDKAKSVNDFVSSL